MKSIVWITGIGLVATLFAWLPESHFPVEEDPTQEAFCASDMYHEAWLQSDVLHSKKQKFLDQLWIAQGGQHAKSAAQYTLPIVVHIIHNNGPEDLPDAVVLDGIQHLNDAFENINYYDQGTGVNTDIEFCLAKQDPDGVATTGINHVQNALTDLNMNQDLDLKDLIRWDPTQYINIWVVREICSPTSCSVAGYATLPASAGSDADGIVMEASWFGSTEGNSSVIVHEMGHYLGLYHTFQDGCVNNDCLLDGDNVCDTPPDGSTIAVPCNADVNTCSTDTNSGFSTDQNDMFWNYMDYGDFDCYSAFTQGQSERMHFHIDNVRFSLLDSPACNDPCFSPINAEFSVSSTQINTGTTLNFNNLSNGATSYEWYVEGNLIATTFNSSFTFNDEGLFEVTLLAFNNDPNCIGEFNIIIDVDCPVEASFQVSSNEVSPGSVVYFTNTSQNATAYDWYLDGVLVSNDQNFDNLFNNLGNFDVQLVASDGICSDTTALSVITVSTTGLSQTGLPIWPLTSNLDDLLHAIDWREIPPDVFPVGNTSFSTAFGSSGAAFDGCGNLAFFAVQSGSSDPDNLFIYAPDGTVLLDNTTPNGPGLNCVRATQEIQVVRVPELSNEWFIIYDEWSSDLGAPLGNAGYNANRIAYSRVRLEGSDLTVLEKDIILTDGNGIARTYNDGKAVSRTANGSVNQHFLYATRRAENASTLSVDRFLITQSGISFDDNTGEVTANYWNLTHAGSHVELSPTEDRLVVGNRNQFNNFQDYFIFNTATFSNTDYQVIEANELVLVQDGTANDQSSVLPYTGVLDDIAYDNSLQLNFLRNFDRKIARCEFSPNGRFLYIVGGGYSAGSFTNVTYLAQIDLDADPMEVRLQVQTPPNGVYSPITGLGCALSDCGDDYRAIADIESGYDGNLYFLKRQFDVLFVIPDPNNVMPQNLVPSNIDLSTPNEPNIQLASVATSMPDQIDGFNYLLGQYQEVAIVVDGTDCADNCLAPYDLELTSTAGEVIALTAIQCPDTLYVCVDTAQVYSLLQPDLNINYDSAVVFAEVIYPGTATLFDFSDNEGCIELCGNGTDDDGDGLIDCDDPDLIDSCCCINPVALDLGPDQIICENGIATFDAGPGFASYLWSDNTNDPVLSVSEPGVYWLFAVDLCGVEYMDTVEVILDPGTVLDLGPDQVFCSNDQNITITASGFDHYQWFPDTYLGGCDTCSTVTIEPDADITYILLGSTDEGCLSADTITIMVEDSSLTILDIEICNGETFVFDGMELDPGTSTSFEYQSEAGCDSTILVNVVGNNEDAFFLQIDTVACLGDFFLFDGVNIPAGSIDTFEYQTTAGCDSVIVVDVGIILQVYDTDEIILCAGDSALIFGNYETTSGEYVGVFTASNGCDSIQTYILDVLDPIFVQALVDPTCKDDPSGTIELLVNGGLPPYSYAWSGPFGNSSIAEGLDAGDYSYTVTDANGCSIEGMALVDVSDVPIYSITFTPPTCFDDSDASISIITDNPDLTFSLDDSFYQGSPEFQFLPGGAYTVYVQDLNGCVYPNDILIPLPQELMVALPADTLIQLGEELDVQSLVNVTGPLIYEWTPVDQLPCLDCPDQEALFPLQTTLLTVTVTDTMGCVDVDSMLIRVEKPRNVYIPNAFSPDFDGINDKFQIFAGIDVLQVNTLRIFDRWGELIYEENNFVPNSNEYGWDGTFRGELLNPGVFTYMAEIVFIDGQVELYTGAIHLLR